ncbi:sensor domain-containing diguanylate cyclase [Paenibacillus arenilitoris]|uniref:Sensor domain-containing diguanylate cyclase n=1 Tax=Paenibacillus arenilitoris TaxID=2772299 RepID=A0A927CRB9_9BACL|nr:sensor domain-containing diguanylate cyclase [Paenibacillus arenilitoris]MBD2872085.1 sensor domain-containing diguanylate cyclase [Paenibacillus arenilitoris]
MSSKVRSLEEAAEHIIDILKQVLQVDGLYIAVIDGTENRIIRAFDRQRDFIPAPSRQQLLQQCCKLVIEHSEAVLVIPDVREDERTAGLPLAKELGPLFFAGAAIRTSANRSFGTICALGREPIRFDGKQLALLESLAVSLGYIVELENDSVTDSLTGLFNRRYLSYLYQNGSDKQFSVMFIDINDFKEVNDSYGHDFGDQLLLEIAARLKKNVRKSDIIVRYGGDEFVICFQHLVDHRDYEIVADKLKDSIMEPFLVGGRTIRISASIGISSTHGASASLKDLITDADKAMYGIKQNEKNL